MVQRRPQHAALLSTLHPTAPPSGTHFPPATVAYLTAHLTKIKPYPSCVPGTSRNVPRSRRKAKAEMRELASLLKTSIADMHLFIMRWDMMLAEMEVLIQRRQTNLAYALVVDHTENLEGS